MGPSEWVRDRILSLARQHPIVWVEEPYGLLSRPDFDSLQALLAAEGQPVVAVRNALRLREFLNGLSGVSARRHFVVVDQSYTLRDPHLPPNDAKPSDLVPLPAPDWKPFVLPDARLRLTVRDFLVDATGFDDWRSEVNIYPYEKLARERPADFIRAYETFRAMGRTLTSHDLILVGASAVLGVNLFDLSDPLLALELAFRSNERWGQLERLFNERESELIRLHLRAFPKPLGELFEENSDIARAAVVGLLVLTQHYPDAPGKHLAYASPVFSKYRDCDMPEAGHVPQWFIEEEVPRFERFCAREFLDHVRDTLALSDPDNGRAFGQRERLSGKLRSLAAFQIERPPLVLGTTRDPFRLEHLVPELTQLRSALQGIVAVTRVAIQNLRLKQPRKLELKQFLHLFADQGFYRVDRILGRLDTLIYYVEGPARSYWSGVPGFAERWAEEVRGCRDLMKAAEDLRDEIDLNFGRLLEERYSEIVPNEVLPADLFYEKFIAERRRQGDGSLRRAVVLVIDSMRLDIWREIVRPALEQDYEVEESLGFALLPTETYFSRRSFFAGKPPGAFGHGAESDLFAGLVSSVHSVRVEFEELKPRPPGMAFAVRSKDNRRSTYAGVFDFPDALSHQVNWDPHTLHEVQRPLVNGIRALLREIGDDALVFITADHGHMLQSKGKPVQIRDAVDGVGYRSAHVTTRVEGEAAARVFQFEARKLRHNASGWFLFPKPGYALRDADQTKRFRPSDSYRHGGISMTEVVVPLACLRHRSVRAKVKLTANLRERAVVGKTACIDISMMADGVLTSPVFVTADEEGIQAATIGGVSTTPQSAQLSYLPVGPGKRRIRFTALLAGEPVGDTMLEINVSKSAEPEADVARAKLSKLFGDD